MFTRLSLKYQIALTIIVLAAIVLALALERTLSAFTASTRSQIERAQKTTLTLLQDTGRQALLTEEYEHARKVFTQTLEDPYVNRVLLADTTNRIMLSTTPEEVGSPLPALTETEERFWRTQDYTNNAGKLGLLAIEFSTAPLLQSQRTARNLGVGIGTTGILLIALVGLGMGVVLTRRLDKLAQAAQRLAAGDSQVETGLSGRDEIAQVGQAFDTMSATVMDHRNRLEASHQFLQSTVDALSSHLAILDEHGTVLEVNDVWRRFAQANAFLGASHGVGSNYLTICDEAAGEWAEEAPSVTQGIREVMSGQRDRFELEYPCHSPEEPRWFLVKVTSFESPDGLRMVVAHENITERKLAEEALQQSEERFRSMVESSIQGIYIHQDGVIQFANPALAQMLGYDNPSDLVGHAYEVIIAPHERVRLEGYREARLRGETPPSRYEYQAVRKEGELVWHECLVTRLSWAGKPSILAAFVDITERKQTEEALQESQAELTTAQQQLIDAIESLTEGFALYDEEDRLVLCNQNYRELYRESEDLLVSGAHFENHIRTSAYRGQIAEAVGREEEWVRERVAQHQNPHSPFEQQQGNGRWLLVSERPTSQGGIVGVRTDITERKQAEEALRHSEAQIRAVLDTAVDSIISITEQGNILSFNAAAEYLFGYRAEEVQGQNVNLLMPSPFQEEHDGYLAQYVRTGEKKIIGIGREVIGKRKDGATFPMDLAVGEAQVGGQRFFTGIVRDITDRKQAEEALRDSEQRYRAIFDQQYQLAGVLSPDGILLEANQRSLTLSGLQAADVIGRPFWDTTWWSHSPELQQRLRDAITAAASGQVVQFEATHPRPDGAMATVDFSLRPVTDDQGQVQFLVPESQDITERKQAEDALRRSETRYRTLIEQSLQGISITREGRRLFANRTFATTFGFDQAEDVMGEDMRARIAPHDLARIEAYSQARLRGEPAPEFYEFQGVRKDGTAIWIENLVSVIDWEGEPASMSITIDVTARKELEAVLHRTNAELEQQVKDRTAALEAANEEVRRFAYIVSHDLRAPLVNLKGFASELREACGVIQAVLPTALPHLDETQQQHFTTAVEQDLPEALGFIDASVNRMDGLIQGVLQLSRVGNRDLHFEPVATEELVHDIVQSLAHQLMERQAQVSIGPLPGVVADRAAMEQILGNLLGNAVKYLEPGRPGEITVSAERGADATTFQVCDNGRGIAEEDIPRVFELFRRVGRQDTPGEGMGLAYVQALIRRHGGEITCQSTQGAGATFSFTIATDLVSGEPDATS